MLQLLGTILFIAGTFFAAERQFGKAFTLGALALLMFVL